LNPSPFRCRITAVSVPKDLKGGLIMSEQRIDPAAGAKQLFKNFDVSAEPYKVKSGDTLSKIVKTKYPSLTTPKEVMKAVAMIVSRNGLANPNKIEPGASLVMPSTKEILSISWGSAMESAMTTLIAKNAEGSVSWKFISETLLPADKLKLKINQAEIQEMLNKVLKDSEKNILKHENLQNIEKNLYKPIS
jgi:hypothetical protein